MLTPFGLSLNFIGSIILLGSDIEIIEKAIKRMDPIHFVYMKGLREIIRESESEKLKKEGRAYPYNQSVSVHSLTWWALSWFITRHVDQDLPRDANVDIRGGWFKINGEQLTFPERREIQLEAGGYHNVGTTASLNAIYGLLYEARMRRIYIYGVTLLAFGFFFQFVSSLF